MSCFGEEEDERVHGNGGGDGEDRDDIRHILSSFLH